MSKISAYLSCIGTASVGDIVRALGENSRVQPVPGESGLLENAKLELDPLLGEAGGAGGEAVGTVVVVVSEVDRHLNVETRAAAAVELEGPGVVRIGAAAAGVNEKVGG